MTLNVCIYFVNGHPRSGKDTFVDYVSEHCDKIEDFTVCSISSIECVRQLTYDLGLVPIGRKEQRDRDLWAELGFSLEKHNQFRTRSVVDYISSKVKDRKTTIAFVHVREQYLMDSIKHYALNHFPVGWQPHFAKIFLDSNRAERVTSNASDRDVESITYDIVVENNHGLPHLAGLSVVFAGVLADLAYEAEQKGSPDLLAPLFEEGLSTSGKRVRLNVVDDRLTINLAEPLTE